jgi:hypothetical protein
LKQHSNSLKKRILHTALPGPDSSQPRLNRKPADYLKPIADAIEIWRGGQGIEVAAGVKNLPGLLPMNVP